MSEETDNARLLNGLLEGSLSAAEAQRVRLLLQDSPALRRDYYDLVAVDLLLAERYEMPDHIAMQAQVMEESSRFDERGGFNPRRWKLASWAGAGIAAALALSWVGMSYFGSRQRDISVVVSPDSHYEVNGVPAPSGVLAAGDTIEVKHGVVSLALTPYVAATIEGPATMKLGDRQGRVSLIAGSAYFDVSPGGSGDLEVESPSGVIRDIGTKFGVTVWPGGEVETQVEEGRVEIERDPGVKTPVAAGYSAAWGRTGAVTAKKSGGYSYSRFLPDEMTLLMENFPEEDGVTLADKAPRIGQKWKAEVEAATTVVREGRFDTSGSQKAFSVGFATPKSLGDVYIMTFRTRPPTNVDDKPYYHEAEESLSLRDEHGNTLVSLVARASRGHRWQLKDESTGKLSYGTRVSAFEDRMLTLTFDRRTSTVRLFEGASTQSPLIDSLKVVSNNVPSALAVSNTLGGDLSIDDINVRMVTYQR